MWAYSKLRLFAKTPHKYGPCPWRFAHLGTLLSATRLSLALISQTTSQVKSYFAVSPRMVAGSRRRLAKHGFVPDYLWPSARLETPPAANSGCVKEGSIFAPPLLFHPLLGQCKKTEQELFIVGLEFRTVRRRNRIGTSTPLRHGNRKGRPVRSQFLHA